MREIKFRGKSENNGEWLYGGIEINVQKHFAIIYDERTPYDNEYSVIPESVGQYTGLKDDNGREIFEGDILKLQLVGDEYHKTVRVEFGNPNCAYDWGYQIVPFGNFPYRKDILLWIETETDRVKVNVIGNITDNPELIKGE